jgi:hypothetical protein
VHSFCCCLKALFVLLKGNCCVEPRLCNQNNKNNAFKENLSKVVERTILEAFIAIRRSCQPKFSWFWSVTNLLGHYQQQNDKFIFNKYFLLCNIFGR